MPGETNSIVGGIFFAGENAVAKHLLKRKKSGIGFATTNGSVELDITAVQRTPENCRK